MPSIPSGWLPRRRADSLIRASPKRLPRVAKERRPEVMMHPDDAAPVSVADGELKSALGNRRGTVRAARAAV